MGGRNPPGGDVRSAPGASMRPRAIPAFLIRGHEVPLAQGETLIGRSPDCRIAIVGPLVSRKHARIVNEHDSVRIEDLGSRNGVFTNGVRVEGSVTLNEGDSVLIGTTELAFFFAQVDETTRFERMVFDEQGNVVTGKGPGGIDDASTLVHFEADEDTLVRPDREETTAEVRQPKPRPQEPSTLPSMGVVPRMGQLRETPRAQQPLPRPSTSLPRQPDPARPVPRAVELPSGQSQSIPSSSGVVGPPPSSEPLSTVFEIFDRMVARGDLDAAGRALAGQLAKRLEGTGKRKPLDGSVLEGAAARCLILAERVGHATWLHNAVDLYRLARKPMSARILDGMLPLLSTLPCDRTKIEGYQAAIREILGEVSVDELDLCERILSL
jgi:pSer/pThr/pTyr-binding forkhead associated (FHA) protein